MTRTKRGNSKFPPKFMKRMKKLKRKRMRNTSIKKVIVEQSHNAALMEV